MSKEASPQSELSIDPRLGCSTISFRRWPLTGALAEIKAQGFSETDLGSLPGVCDHVPIPLPADRIDELAEQIRDSGVTVRLINADVADMDDPDLDATEMQRRLQTLVDLARAVGTSTIMLPCGRQGTEPRTELSRDIATVARTLTAAADSVNAAGLDLLVEAPHSRRLCATVERSEMLYEDSGTHRLAPCWTSATSSRAAATRLMPSVALTAESGTCISAMPSWAISTSASDAAR
jgi:sugar phosphate isomerase/epimerase